MIAGIGIAETVLRVLHFDQAKVVLGVTVQIHAAARVESKIARVSDAEIEANPVGIFRAVPACGREKAFWRGICTHHQSDVAVTR